MKKSNLYIEKIYSDHPIACWALDDDTSYRQLLSQSPLDWTAPFGAGVKQKAPPIEDAMLEIVSVSNPSTTILYNTGLGSFLLDPTIDDVTFSVWVYHPSTTVTSYEIGYIDHTDDSEYFSVFTPVHEGWYHLFDTFATASVNSLCELFIRIYADGGESVYINAPSLGQNSEEYCSYSMGYTSANLQTTLTLDEYGMNVESNGVYNLNTYAVPYVREGSIPLAFGSYKALHLIPDNNGGGTPIQLPGSGFLHENGKNKNYTLEFWTRLINYADTPRRIFGAIDSTDGIYVEENFISVYIGPYTKSYFVGKWYRPMLIHFEYSPKNVYLFINGERVISIDIDVDKIPFSTGADEIGFFASTYFSPFEIDSVALYPYTMPTEMAKKHFIYGQGVQDFDFSNDKFLRKNVQVDFPFAEYAYNVIYPDTVKWRSGYSENLDTSSSYIKPVTHQLPDVLPQKDGAFTTTDQWLLDNYNLNVANSDILPYVKMLPTGSYTNCSIYFKTLTMFNPRLKSMFGMFRSPSTPTANQEVLKFTNKQTGESLRVILNNTSLDYYFYDSSGTVVGSSLHTDVVPADEYFYAGVDFDEISRNYYSTVGIAFADKNKISMSVGGTQGNMFAGRVYTITLSDATDYYRSMQFKYTNGFINQDSGTASLVYYISTYTLCVLNSNTSLIFDIGTAAFWEDSLPLSMFGKNVSTPTGRAYDLDMIQFNIDAQYKKIFEENNLIPYNAFEAIIRTSLDTYDDIASHYASYDTLYQQTLDIYNSFKVDTGIKTYLVLQHHTQVGNKPYSDYVNTVTASPDFVVEFNTGTLDTTKYEVYDNYTVLIPKTIDFNEYYLTIYIDIKIKGTISKNMILKRCELSSFVFNDGSDTRVGTKNSIPLYPFAEAI